MRWRSSLTRGTSAFGVGGVTITRAAVCLEAGGAFSLLVALEATQP